jgi:hypothetical protein
LVARTSAAIDGAMRASARLTTAKSSRSRCVAAGVLACEPQPTSASETAPMSPTARA